MFGQVFYFSIIRKYVVLVGSLFNDIQIVKTNANNIVEVIKIPVSYAPKDTMLARVQQDPDIDRKSSTPTLPLISFEMGQMSYNASRKISTTNKISYKKDANNFKYVYSPVPWDFNFKVYIFVKNVEDGTKIIEQILPYFTPDWTTKVNLIPEMEEVRDIPIILKSVGMEDNYDSKDLTKRRDIIWTIDLLLQGYLYGPINIGPIIKYANTSFYAFNGTEENSQYGGSILATPGLTSNGTPTSNSSLSIPVNQIEVTDDFGFVIEKSYG